MEIKYNLNVGPYYDTTNEELEKNYIQYLAVDGQRLQNRELNVAQGLIRGNARKITDLIIEDGSVVSGCNFVNDNVNKICTLYEGEVYVNGVIVKIPEMQWTHSQVPIEDSIVYADILPMIVTPIDDASLYNPAENYESFGDPGGHRLKYEASVGIVKEKDFTNLLVDNKTIVALLNIRDRNTYGPIKSKPLFNKISAQMNQNLYDTSGDFIAEGLKVSTLKHADDPLNKYNVRITAGRCYIRGVAYTLLDTTLKVDNNSINVNSTLTRNVPEEHIYSTVDENYYLNHTYAKDIINIYGNVIITGLSIITVGNVDDISPTGYNKTNIVNIDKVYTDIIYIKKDAINALTGEYDYENIGSKIIWNTSTPVNEKPIGSFFVDFVYNKVLTNLVDYHFAKDETGYYIKFINTSDNKLKSGLTFSVNYSWYMPRIDLVYMNHKGIPSIKQGIATDETKLTEPVVPAGSLPLAVIYITPNVEPYNYYIKSFNLYRVPVGQLQDIKKRLNNLEYDVVMSNLETQMQNKHLSTDTNGSYSLRNIYTDSIVDYTKTDTTNGEFNATVDIFRNAIYQPMKMEQLGFDKVRFMLESTDILNNKVYTEINPLVNNIISANVTDNIYEISSQSHATDSIDIAPFYYKGLLPNITCNPNKLVYVEDDGYSNVVWLPNRVIYSSNIVNSIDSNITDEYIYDGKVVEGWNLAEWKKIHTGWNSLGKLTVIGSDMRTVTSTSTTKETSIETVDVTKSAISLISQPYMKAGQIVTVKGQDFEPNTEIRLYLDEKIVTTEFTNTRYNDVVLPMTSPVISGTTIDPYFETITYVQRPHQWAYNFDKINNMFKFHHPRYKDQGIEYFYNHINKRWFYKILKYHTTLQSLDRVPGWCKFVTRSPWIQNYISSISDVDIINEINNVNNIDVTTNTTYTTEYSEAKVTVITDQNGEFEVEIAIPENTPVGSHIITAETVLPANFDPDYYKEVTDSFTGESYLRHWDSTIYKRVVENIKTTTYNVTTKVNKIKISDPISQTFKLSNAGFINGIDLYFSRVVDITDTTTQPWISIREVENGIPSSNILYTQFINKSIILDADDVTTGVRASIPTYIQFNNPIYIEADKEYAFTIGANQDGYHLYYSKIGSKDVSTGESVLYQKQQSEAGVMLVSSNNSTWSTMQDSDVKYTLYRTEFDTINDKIIYIDNITPETLPNFGVLNLSIANIIYENTNISLYYNINSSDIYSSSTEWIAMSFEELIEFAYSDNFNSAMKVAFKIVLSTNDSTVSPVINLNTFELFLAKYLSKGAYTQLTFDINY